MNHALRRISLACLVLFVALLVNVNYVQGFQTNYLADKPGNARTFAEQFNYQRGSIVTSDNVTVAESKHVSGIYSYQRYYPQGPVYAPVTGYDTLYSTTGIEQAENKNLSGSTPALTVPNLVDLITGKPKQGAKVQLTINSAAQQAAYHALAQTKLPSGAVAIDPSTGAILALASYPTFNPNKYATLDGNQLNAVDAKYQHDPAQPLLNRAIDATFPPGSTFKIVTSSTAFATGRYNPNTVVFAPTNLSLPGTTKQLINYDNLPCGDGTGHESVILSFTFSCNTVFGNIGMHLGGAALHQQAGKFGFNTPLNIPVPVAESRYPPVSDPALTAYSAIGQYNDQVTPLQEAMLSAAIANHGTLMKPYLVQKVTAPDTSTLESAQPSALSQAVSSQVAGEVAQLMQSVVDNPQGTAHFSAYFPNLPIACKTGTAQNGVNNTGLDDAVITCFSSNPEIAVGVIVKGGGLGADASAPVAVAIIKAYKQYLDTQGK
ncbi:MAG TPA: penicillin-binding protein 2 [Streptosporangiaceae bacterium]|nr:penicillin-binding protein 2 [Streptosporangiaceae bacterium]